MKATGLYLGLRLGRHVALKFLPEDFANDRRPLSHSRRSRYHVSGLQFRPCTILLLRGQLT